MDILEYYYIFLKRKWIIISAFLTVSIITLIWLLIAAPIYDSKAKILISENTSSSPLGGLIEMNDLMSVGSFGKADPIANQIEVIKTRPILREVIETLKLTDKDGDLLDIEAFVKQVKISAIRNTNIIVITFRNKDKKLAAAVVNTIASVVVKNNREINQEESRLARIFIESQLEKRRESLQISEKILIDFQSEENAISLDTETELMITRLSQISVSKIETDSKIQAAKAQMNKLKKQIKKAGQTISPFISQWKNNLDQLESELAYSQAVSKSFNSEIININKSLKQLPPKEIAFARLISDTKIENEIYNKLLMHLEETKIAEAAQIASIRIIEPGEPSRYPVFPKKKKSLLVAMMFGLFLGGGIAFILDFFDHRLRTIEEIDEITGWNRLGVIPTDTESLEETHLITKVSPKSPIAESYRTLRTNIHYTHIDKKPKKILITSSGPGEGKSTVISNLALTQCMLGQKVLLVDLDLRKPKIHKMFGMKNVVGLTNVIAGSIPLKEAIQKTDMQNFSVLPTGPIPPNPAELLESNSFTNILKDLEDSFDMILMDAPPFNIVTDATILFKKADGYLFVIDIENTSRHLLKQSVENISNINYMPLGYIVNNLSMEKGKYYGSTYAYQYQYSE
jgi:polysaccharide biosynthesis transport protein